MRRLWPWHSIYYGWVLVLVLSLTETTSWGVLYYAFSVFLTPMQADLGWSTAQLTGAFSLALLVSGLVGIPAGRWLDRRGPRLLMTSGSIAATLLVLAWSRVSSLPAFYLIWAGIGLTMAAVFYEPAFVVVANWFNRLRGRALTVLTFLAGFASVIYIPLANWLVQGYGWRTALVVLAAILAAGTIPLHALFLRRHPSDLGLQPDGAVASPEESGRHRAASEGVPLSLAIRDAAFWWLTGAFVLTMLANGALTVHLIPYLIEHGHSPGFAATAAGLIGIMALPGRLVFTPLGSYLPRRVVTAGIFSFQALGLLVLLLAQGGAGVVAFVILFGAGFGAITPARAALVAQNYGPAHYGSISGILALFLTGARAAGPISAGIGYAWLGGYRDVFWVLTVVSAIAALAVLRCESTLRQSLELETAT